MPVNMHLLTVLVFLLYQLILSHGFYLNTTLPLTVPTYPNAFTDMLAHESTKNRKSMMKTEYSKIPRYGRATTVQVGACQSYYFTTTRVNAADFANAPTWLNYGGNEIRGNNEVSLDRACE